VRVDVLDSATVSDTHLSCDDRPACSGSVSQLDGVSFCSLGSLEISSHLDTLLGDDLIRFDGATDVSCVESEFCADVGPAPNVQALFPHETSGYSPLSSTVPRTPFPVASLDAVPPTR